MLAALALSLVGWVPVDEAAKNELLAVAKKLEAVQSYHFEHAMSGGARAGKADAGEGGAPPAGEGGADGAKGRRDPDVWQVDFQRGRPAQLKRGEQQFFRSEKKLATLDPTTKQWTSVARGGGAPPAGDGGEKGAGQLVRTANEIERLLFPHVVVKELGKKVLDVTRSEAGGVVTYVATLDPEVARELAGAGGERTARREGGRREGRREGGKREGGEAGKEGGEGGEPATGGAAAGGERIAKSVECDGKVTFVASNGQITSLDIEVTFKGQQPRVQRRTLKLSAIDATTVEPPAEAIAVLDIK